MKESRLLAQLELAHLRLLLCNCPDKAQAISGEIHEIKANLYRRRKRDQKYRDGHRAFQRSLIRE